MESVRHPPPIHLSANRQGDSIAKSLILHGLLAFSVAFAGWFAPKIPGPRSESIEVMLSAPGPAKPALDAKALPARVPPAQAPKPRAVTEPKPRPEEMSLLKELTKRKTEALKKALEETEAPPSQAEAKASAPAQAPVAAQEASSIGGGGTGAEFTARDRYLAEVRALMERQKRYPTRAKMMRQEGRVEIAFTVSASGAISDIELVKPSPNSALNQATLEILSKIARFKPIPSELRLSSLRLTVPVEYHLQ